MELVRFENLESLNGFLATAENVKKVKVLTETGPTTYHNGMPLYQLKSVFFVLIDGKHVYQKEHLL